MDCALSAVSSFMGSCSHDWRSLFLILRNSIMADWDPLAMSGKKSISCLVSLLAGRRL